MRPEFSQHTPQTARGGSASRRDCRPAPHPDRFADRLSVTLGGAFPGPSPAPAPIPPRFPHGRADDRTIGASSDSYAPLVEADRRRRG